jgi:superfamily II DNA/RNA helicase
LSWHQRELALQIGEEIFNIGRFKRIKVETLIGHSSFQAQARNLKERTHVVVAHGRLLDHIDQARFSLIKSSLSS